MDRIQAVNAMTVLVCEQGFTETAAREILAADAEGYDILCLTPETPSIPSIVPS